MTEEVALNLRPPFTGGEHRFVLEDELVVPRAHIELVRDYCAMQRKIQAASPEELSEVIDEALRLSRELHEVFG